MATGHVNLIKLCVGAETVRDLEVWQQTPRAKGPDGRPRHVTRMWPKRAGEVTGGGSLYWVIRGVILARQHILRLDEVMGGDGITRCGIVLDAAIHRTEATPRRPFQGWRYLAPEDSPADRAAAPAGREGEEELPPALASALSEIGVR